MLQPKRVKYRRPHRLSYEGKSKAVMKHPRFWITCEGAYVTNRQIEAARITLARYTRRTGKI